ncbi:MAG: hypothetical protein ACOCZQ_03750, partial [Nanoarchaeota archaeon]
MICKKIQRFFILTMLTCLFLPTIALAEEDSPGLFDMFDIDPDLLEFDELTLENLSMVGPLYMNDSDLFMQGHKIRNLQEPSEISDAATKGYVDDALSIDNLEDELDFATEDFVNEKIDEKDFEDEVFDTSDLPSCGSGQALSWDGEEWSCVDLEEVDISDLEELISGCFFDEDSYAQFLADIYDRDDREATHGGVDFGPSWTKDDVKELIEIREIPPELHFHKYIEPLYDELSEAGFDYEFYRCDGSASPNDGSGDFDTSVLPSCGSGEALSWDGEEWSCVSVGDG